MWPDDILSRDRKPLVVNGSRLILEATPFAVRRFTMSFHTIKDGEQALIFNRGGSGRVVVGPRRVRARVCVCGKVVVWV